MKITMQIDQGRAFELHHSIVQDVAFFLEDIPSNAQVFEDLSKHPSSLIRATVAAKEHLSVKAVQRLANDSSIEVVQAISQNIDALKLLGSEALVLMIKRDVSIAKAFLEIDLEDINPSIKEAVMDALAKYDDPVIQEGLATLKR